MAETLIIAEGTKEQRYKVLLRQIRSILQAENDPIANMATIVSALKETFGWLWVGFYRVIGDELVLGPYQGPLACTRIKRGRGVCGSAWAEASPIVVADVEQFPGHIACSSLSRSEIVIPIFTDKTDTREADDVIAVLDIDSAQLDTFDNTDVAYLTVILTFMTRW